MTIQAPDVLSVIRATLMLTILYTVVVYAKFIAIGIAITAGVVLMIALVGVLMDYRDSIRSFKKECGYFKPLAEPQTTTPSYMSGSLHLDATGERPFVRRRRSRSGSY